MRPLLKVAILGAVFFVFLFSQGTVFAAPHDSDCNAQFFKLPEINISISEKPARFDMSKAIEDLARMKMSASRVEESNDFQILVRGAGVMSGDIAASHAVAFDKGDIVIINGAPHQCYAISKIQITLSMSPKIYVAEDFNDHACLFREIFAHEGKHIEIDRDVLEDNAQAIRQALQFALKSPKDYVFVSKPEAVNSAMQIVRNDLGQMLEGLYISMIQKRNIRQAALDTPLEYSRIVETCPEIIEILQDMQKPQEQ